MSRLTPVFGPLLALLLSPGAAMLAAAQNPPESRERAEITLQVRVMGERNFVPPQGLLVELLDTTDTPFMQSFTGTNGSTQFRLMVRPGSGALSAPAMRFRLRVSGQGIESHTSDIFRIHRMQRSHTETVSVRPEGGSGADTSVGKATVSAAELKIPRGARRDFERGNAALEQQQWPEAVQHFERAIAAYPEYPSAHNNLGIALMRVGEMERGQRALERALELDESIPGIALNLARIAYGDQQFERAKDLLRRALASDAHNPETLMLLADAHLRTAQWEDAVHHAHQVHSLEHERFANAHLVAAQALELLGRPDRAAAEYALYLEEAPRGPNAGRARAALEALRQQEPKQP